MANKIHISNGIISIDYTEKVQLISLKFRGNVEFEVIPEDCVAIYNNNQLIIFFDQEQEISEIVKYKGYINLTSIKVANTNRIQKLDNILIRDDVWDNNINKSNWENINGSIWEELTDDRDFGTNPNIIRPIVKFKRRGVEYVDPKSINKRHRTSLNHNHKHSYVLDAKGNGYTTYNNGHRHKVANFLVYKNNNHRHKIKNKGKIRYGIK